MSDEHTLIGIAISELKACPCTEKLRGNQPHAKPANRLRDRSNRHSHQVLVSFSPTGLLRACQWVLISSIAVVAVKSRRTTAMSCLADRPRSFQPVYAFRRLISDMLACLPMNQS